MGAAAVKLPVDDDPTVYPIEDDVGEGSLQRFISELLRGLIVRWLAEKGSVTFVGADQFFYWEKYNPAEGVAPDVYVVPGVPPNTKVGAWKVWQTSHVPSFAFEVVSQDVDKDYFTSPAKYSRLGVKELIVFDPEYQQGSDRVQWQIFRRSRKGLLRVEATDADRIRSRELGCWLRVVGEGGDLRVRVAYGDKGATLLPTDAEERERAEAGRQRAEAALEQERAARRALEEELARLRGQPSKPAPRRARAAKKPSSR